MKKTYASIGGTCDWNPLQTRLFNKISQKARRIFKVFGYEEIILPVLEKEELFRRGVGEITEIVQKQMFKIEAKDIVLRPEGTAQVIRYYLENFLYKQSDFHKFFYIGAMFRGERPQKGRLRQFHHIGAEAIGSEDYYLDAELISLALKILEELGVREKELLINSLGCVQDKEKFSKELKKTLSAKRNQLCEDCQRRIEVNPLRVLDCKSQSCKQVVSSLDWGEDYLCLECQEHFEGLLSLLDDLKIKYTRVSSLVRGLDYYTHTVFEITSKSLGSQDALGAGGRYNNLVGDLGGPQIPAFGFALGVERILLALKETGNEERMEVFVATTDESLLKVGFKILQRLREGGLSVDIDYCRKSLKGQLRYAQKKGVRFVVIVGEEELKEEQVMLKDMKKSTQEKVKIDELVSLIQRTKDKE